MNDQVTVYLTARVSPAGTDWAQGYVQKHTEAGIWLNEHSYGRTKTTFYPAHMIQRVEYR